MSLKRKKLRPQSALGSVSIAVLIALILPIGFFFWHGGVAESHTRNDDAWSYFLPAWEKNTLSDEYLPVKSADLQRLVKDPARLSQFSVPSSLEEKVIFWLRIYTQIDSYQKLLHDRSHPHIVYGYIDLKPLYRRIKDRMKRQREIHKIEKEIFKTLAEKMVKSFDEKDSISASNLVNFLKSQGIKSKEEALKASQDLRTQTGQRDVFISAIRRSKHLLPHMQNQFEQEKLPADLARIPFVESSFNPRAGSKDGARGIWQFMPVTAQQMIHPTDQKLWADPFAQTKAAIRLLKLYRKILPDWGSVITGYNSGVGRMQELLKKYHVRNLVFLLQRPDLEGLGFAGKNFYTEFLAANLIVHYKDQLYESWQIQPQIELALNDLDAYPQLMCTVPSKMLR